MRGEGLGEGGSAGLARALLVTLPRPLAGLPSLGSSGRGIHLCYALPSAGGWGLGATTPAKPLRFTGLRGGGGIRDPRPPRAQVRV